MLLIQIVAAALLVLGSALILHALIALDQPPRPRRLVRPHARRSGLAHATMDDEHLSRAA